MKGGSARDDCSFSAADRKPSEFATIKAFRNEEGPVHGALALEELAEFLLSGLEGEVADEDLGVKTAWCESRINSKGGTSAEQRGCKAWEPLSRPKSNCERGPHLLAVVLRGGLDGLCDLRCV